jgi:hypothetical protein
MEIKHGACMLYVSSWGCVLHGKSITHPTQLQDLSVHQRTHLQSIHFWLWLLCLVIDRKHPHNSLLPANWWLFHSVHQHQHINLWLIYFCHQFHPFHPIREMNRYQNKQMILAYSWHEIGSHTQPPLTKTYWLPWDMTNPVRYCCENRMACSLHPSPPCLELQRIWHGENMSDPTWCRSQCFRASVHPAVGLLKCAER